MVSRPVPAAVEPIGEGFSTLLSVLHINNVENLPAVNAAKNTQ